MNKLAKCNAKECSKMLLIWCALNKLHSKSIGSSWGCFFSCLCTCVYLQVALIEAFTIFVAYFSALLEIFVKLYIFHRFQSNALILYNSYIIHNFLLYLHIRLSSEGTERFLVNVIKYNKNILPNNIFAIKIALICFRYWHSLSLSLSPHFSLSRFCVSLQ